MPRTRWRARRSIERGARSLIGDGRRLAPPASVVGTGEASRRGSPTILSMPPSCLRWRLEIMFSERHFAIVPPERSAADRSNILIHNVFGQIDAGPARTALVPQAIAGPRPAIDRRIAHRRETGCQKPNAGKSEREMNGRMVTLTNPRAHLRQGCSRVVRIRRVDAENFETQSLIGLYGG
jgi:hypothetical protein